MLSRRKPNDERLESLARRLDARPLSYSAGLLARADEVNATPLSSPPGLRDGWFVDRFAEIVGNNADDFAAATGALRAWAMFDQPWTVCIEPSPPIEVGTTVTYAARVLGLWWSYGCRILEVIDEPDRFGFVYGTIEGHAERGEELFQVAFGADGAVEFSLFAVSRPGRWFAWPGIAFARRAQRRFRPGAASGVRRAVAASQPTVA